VAPKKIRSGVILECYRRAAEARRMADRATNRPAKADFLAVEQRCLSRGSAPTFNAGGFNQIGKDI